MNLFISIVKMEAENKMIRNDYDSRLVDILD
jgi:hypothetical protein